MQRSFENILIYFKTIFYLLWDSFILLFTPAREQEILKVLVIRPDSIGDFILYLDAAWELKKIYPAGHHKIVLLGNSIWTPIAELLPCFDEVWAIERNRFVRNPFYRFQLLKKIRRAGFHTVIHPVISREFALGDAVIRISGAAERIGSQGDLKNTSGYQRKISDSWYSRLLPVSNPNSVVLIKNSEFIRGLGSEKFLAEVPVLDRAILQPVNLNQPRDYFIIFPGAQNAKRRWPVEKFLEITERIYHHSGWNGVICGSDKERELGSQMASRTKIPLLDLTGRTSLLELLYIISEAHLLVGNETGAIHMAAALSVPAVCILGGGHYGDFLPYQIEKENSRPLPVSVTQPMPCFYCNWFCIYQTPQKQAWPCIANISVESVWEKLEQIIVKRSPKENGQILNN
ncbi:MAG: hypothetical protein A2Y94_15685 [Caldithrix sp. RBG_13_44_9]|nr:MAG: hypothetical protein A2Y94_15685 [Caldithrix sp. RBG_13_44_9]